MKPSSNKVAGDDPRWRLGFIGQVQIFHRFLSGVVSAPTLGVIALSPAMKPEEFEAMQGLETATLLSIAAERPNSRQQAALHILELRRAAELQARLSSKERLKDGDDKWWKKPVGIVILSVGGGLLLAVLKFYFGL